MELTPAQLAALRQAVLAARKQGMPDEQIDAELQKRVGIPLAEVTKLTGLDVARSVTEGVTLGHEDELKGEVRSGFPHLRTALGLSGYPAVMGGDFAKYKTVRDEERARAVASHGMNPKTTLGVELGTGMLPAYLISEIPGAAPIAGGWLAKAASAAKQAGLAGAILGEGKSTAEAPEDIATDAAKTGAFSALLGAGLSTAGSALGAAGKKIRDFRDPAGAAARSAAPLVPDNAMATANDAAALAAKHGVEVPVTPADLSPEMATATAGVGADAATGVQALRAAEARVSMLKNARDVIGQQYEQFKQPVPVTDFLRSLMRGIGKEKALPGKSKVPQEVVDVLGEWVRPEAKEIEASAVHKIRSEILGKARKAARAGDNAKARELGKTAEQLTRWLQEQVPEIKQIDRDYAFIAQRLSAAQKTAKELTNSMRSFTRQRVGGVEPASVGGSLPKATAGLFDAASKLVSPDRAAAARGANEALLTPIQGSDNLQRMLQMKQLLGAPPGPAANILRASLFGDVVPQAANQFGATLFNR